MIGRSGLFADIMCPNDEACWRPHCHFWHSKDEVPQEPSSSGEQPFVGYMGYVGNGELNSSSATISSATPTCSSIYAPVGNDLLTYQPVGIEPLQSPYIASFSGTTSDRKAESSSCSLRRKRDVSPLAELYKPKAPLEMPVDEILDPSQDSTLQPRQSTAAAAPEKVPIREQPKRAPEKKLNDYAKSVADIDTRIEELQRRIEEERRAKQRIVHEIKAKVKSTAIADYVPTKKAATDERYKSKSSSGYSGGYTPTPIAVLKAGKANAEEKQKENERQKGKDKEAVEEGKQKHRMTTRTKKAPSSSSTESTSSTRHSRPKVKLGETLSIEELFEDERYKSKSSSGYSGGYTPTPIAVLKAGKANAEEKQKENERQKGKDKEAVEEGKQKHRMTTRTKKAPSSSSTESTSSTRHSRPKVKLGETLSIEELFEDDAEPVPRKIRISKANDTSRSKLTDERVEAAKRRMAEAVTAQAQMRITATKNRAPNVAQQLNSRYEKLQREKEEIMKK
ncbi:hypothetical protein Tcan_17289 [Toxocara canis]|uniref:Uncharacterized protein n=1 Tax=Toxocara canis TaxID=6265 RepID=A0A0B2V7Z4_TOXCA|nr:hypothetical protein Tcan_17289 [Toxocara canis]